MVEETQQRQHTPPAELGVSPRALGPGRYVQFAFLVLVLVVFWFADNLLNTVWAYFQEPNERLISGLAAVIGMVTGIVLYRSYSVKSFADEVAVELGKVTWPDRKETRYATIVVLVASMVAAVILGMMDMVWSAVTDFIYTGSVPIG